MCFCEEREPIRSSFLSSCGTQGTQALLDLHDTFVRLFLLRPCPTTEHSTDRPPVRKSLFRGEAHSGFAAFLGSTHLAAERMAYGSSVQGKSQAKRVRTLLRQCHRCLALRQPLVRIPKVPQRPRTKAMANHAS